MMDASVVEEIAKDAVHWLRQALALTDWKIHLRIGALPGNTKALCEPDPSTRDAVISIDPEDASDEDDVLHSLLHEMCHVAHGGFEVYRKQVAELIKDREFNALEPAWTHGCELTVDTLMNAFEIGLGMSARELIERAKEKAAADGWQDPAKKKPKGI